MNKLFYYHSHFGRKGELIHHVTSLIFLFFIFLLVSSCFDRTKALVLELLAAVCLVRGGHEIILSAFDNFKEVGHFGVHSHKHIWTSLNRMIYIFCVYVLL